MRRTTAHWSATTACRLPDRDAVSQMPQDPPVFNRATTIAATWRLRALFLPPVTAGEMGEGGAKVAGILLLHRRGHAVFDPGVPAAHRSSWHVHKSLRRSLFNHPIRMSSISSRAFPNRSLDSLEEAHTLRPHPGESFIFASHPVITRLS